MVTEPWLDLWSLDLPNQPVAETLITWAGCLSREERSRTERIRLPGRRAQAIASRALLRQALSHRMGGRPSSWRIEADERGRPHLSPPVAMPDFNVSHTDGMVVCALSSGFPVGIDVEHIDRAAQMAEVEKWFLSPKERETWKKKQPPEDGNYLVRLWTLKEAWSKALGLGLQVDFTSAAFNLDDATSIRFESTDPWHFRSRSHPSGHVVSVGWKLAGKARLSARDGATLMGLV